MLRNLLLLLLSSSVLVSCWPKHRYEQPPVKNVLGYKPVFTNDSSILRIVSDTARKVKNAGKIYALGNFIYQNELGEGLHVLDKSNPSDLKNLGFIKIKGNSEISIKDGYLYVNSYTDLVVVDITNWRQPVEVKRIKNAFSQGNSLNRFYLFIPPPEKNVYYDCSSPWQGFQTGWVKDSIPDTNCYYR